MFNTYFLRARLFPTLLTSIPLLSFYYYYLSPYLHESLTEIPHLPTIGDATISIAVVFFLVQINRLISKEIFQKIFFKDEIEMPSTNYLMYNNDFFPIKIKDEIREKINKQFNIKLFSRSEEESDELNARKTIVLAVSQMRQLLRENLMILRHNIEYGFMRNLIGGSLIALVICIIAIILDVLEITEISKIEYFAVLSIIYLIPVLLCKYIINRYGHYYAKVLIEQFYKFN